MGQRGMDRFSSLFDFAFLYTVKNLFRAHPRYRELAPRTLSSFTYGLTRRYPSTSRSSRRVSMARYLFETDNERLIPSLFSLSLSLPSLLSSRLEAIRKFSRRVLSFSQSR